jgi:hypothetical protein
LLPSSKAGLYLSIAAEIAAFLGAQPSTVNTISVQKIREQLHSAGLVKVSTNSKSWKKAVEHASSHIVGWQKIKNSFERVRASNANSAALAEEAK